MQASQAYTLVFPRNHKAATTFARAQEASGGPARKGGLGDNEVSVKTWMEAIDKALGKKNPPPVNAPATDGHPAVRIELTIADYATAPDSDGE